MNGLSPPELEIIVRAAIDLLTADEKAALGIALAPSERCRSCTSIKRRLHSAGSGGSFLRRLSVPGACVAECKIYYMVLNGAARDKLELICLINYVRTMDFWFIA